MTTQLLLSAHLDMPAPPDWLLNMPLDQITSWECATFLRLLEQGTFVIPEYHDNRGGLRREASLIDADGNPVEATYNYQCHFNTDINQWCKKNILPEIKDIRYIFTQPNYSYVRPHVDFTRKFVAIYLLSTGGGEPCTVFYKEKAQPDLIRPGGYRVNDFRLLEEIGRVVIPLKTWIVLNSQILHSVTNIQGGSRRSIQVSLDSVPDSIVKYAQFINI